MAGLNKVQIIGNLGRDPEMRYTPQGTAVTSFPVAVNRKWSGGEETIWFRVSAWDRLAEICNQYLSKGRQVYIEGRLRPPDVYTDRNGVTRANLEITATDMVMLSGGGGDSSGGGGGGGGGNYDDYADQRPRSAAPERSEPPARNAPQPVGEDDTEDEIPF